MIKQYTAGKDKFWGYRREYKGIQLRRRGFLTKGEAESDLRKAMSRVDSPPEAAPTTLQDALDGFREYLDSEADRRGKGQAYRYGITSTINKLQTFVDEIGPTRLVKEVQKIDMTRWYLRLVKDTSQATAAAHLGRLGGMLRYAQQTRPDLTNWNRPRLNEKAKPTNPGRIVTPEEYSGLLLSLSSPPSCKRIADRFRLWREAADAVRLLRNTGGRLNEVLRMRLSQINLEAKEITLYATKTECERTVPMSSSIKELILSRVREGLTSREFLFARATKPHFAQDIGSAVRVASGVVGLNYGRKAEGGFTLHGLRHSYITELLAVGVDIPTVMKYSGHKSLTTFSVYLHPTIWGQKKAIQHIEGFDDCLVAGANEDTACG